MRMKNVRRMLKDRVGTVEERRWMRAIVSGDDGDEMVGGCWCVGVDGDDGGRSCFLSLGCMWKGGNPC